MKGDGAGQPYREPVTNQTGSKMENCLWQAMYLCHHKTGQQSCRRTPEENEGVAPNPLRLNDGGDNAPHGNGEQKQRQPALDRQQQEKGFLCLFLRRRRKTSSRLCAQTSVGAGRKNWPLHL